MTTTRTAKSLEKRVSILTEAIRNTSTPEEAALAVINAMDENMKSLRRNPVEPPPPGGIGITAASRKYNIPKATISKWVKNGFIDILRKDPNFTYIKEEDIIPLSKVYKNNPGCGRRDVVKKARELKNN